MSDLKNNDLTNMDEAYEFLFEKLHGIFMVEDEVRDGKVYLPQWNMELEPYIQELSETSVVLYFFISSPEWEKDMRECCASVGKDTRSAIEMAIGSFLFAFMGGIARMKNQDEARTLTSTYNDREHKWKAYLSDVVEMGILRETYDNTVAVYWELIEEDVIKRLGNQKVCAVKIYLAKCGDNITSECRIDDIVSIELSEKLAGFVENWEVEGFASEKQFIFIEQEEETFIPHRYHRAVENEAFKSNVRKCMEIFYAAKTDEEYYSLVDTMTEAIGDKTLAIEVFSFLPEMLAQIAFEESVFPEYFTVIINDGERIEETEMSKNTECRTSVGNREVYLHQMSEYFPLIEVALQLIRDKEFGEESDNVYSNFVCSSSICHSVCSMKEAGKEFDSVRFAALAFPVDGDFELR